MPLPNPKLPTPPQPTRVFFDPFNSSSTGHQRAENRLSGSTSWRDSRSHKLKFQFSDSSGQGGAAHISDLVGAGSEHWQKDGRKENGDWKVGAPGLREKGWQDIRSLIEATNRKRKNDSDLDGQVPSYCSVGRRCDSTIKRARYSDGTIGGKQTKTGANTRDMSQVQASPEKSEAISCPSSEIVSIPTAKLVSDQGMSDAELRPAQPPQVFRGLTMYLNGSTAPLVSDHKLKQLFCSHGGNSSIALGRRTVTHVILGKTCGGGLASGKIQKEVRTVGGKGIKYVTAQWVLDSVHHGVRQSEGRYMPSSVGKRIGGSGQASVAGLFRKASET